LNPVAFGDGVPGGDGLGCSIAVNNGRALFNKSRPDREFQTNAIRYP
jgi:hypothetical protein